MTTTSDSTEDEISKDIPLDWYTAGLILIFIAQVLICIGMVCWTQNKLKKMKDDQKKQSEEFYKFLYSFNKMMKLEEEQMNVIMQQKDGKTPN